MEIWGSIIVPLFSAGVGAVGVSYLNNFLSNRRDIHMSKEYILRVLVYDREQPDSIECQRVINLIELIFYNNKEVIDKYKEFRGKIDILLADNKSMVKQEEMFFALKSLIIQIAKDLGYKSFDKHDVFSPKAYRLKPYDHQVEAGVQRALEIQNNKKPKTK